MSRGIVPNVIDWVPMVGWRIRSQSSLLVLRITGEDYIIVGGSTRERIWNQLMQKWDRVFEEVRWGTIEYALELYSKLFEWLDQIGRRVPRYHGGADVVLPPRNLDGDELKGLLGRYERWSDAAET